MPRPGRHADVQKKCALPLETSLAFDPLARGRCRRLCIAVRLLTRISFRKCTDQFSRVLNHCAGLVLILGKFERGPISGNLQQIANDDTILARLRKFIQDQRCRLAL